MHRLKDRSVVMRIGFVCLLASNLSRWFIHPMTSSGQNAFDGAFGVLTGIAIGCLLLSVRRPQGPHPAEPE